MKNARKHASKILNELVQSTFAELAEGEKDGPYWNFVPRIQKELVECADSSIISLTFTDVTVRQIQNWFGLKPESMFAPRDLQGPHGICDYTLWYGDKSMSRDINLVIVEAKR